MRTILPLTLHALSLPARIWRSIKRGVHCIKAAACSLVKIAALLSSAAFELAGFCSESGDGFCVLIM